MRSNAQLSGRRFVEIARRTGFRWRLVPCPLLDSRRPTLDNGSPLLRNHVGGGTGEITIAL